MLRREKINLEKVRTSLSVPCPEGQRVFPSSFTYDELDRVVTATDSLGNVTRYMYDSRNNQIRRVDPLGNVVTTEYDVLGRRERIRQQLNNTGLGGGVMQSSVDTAFEYDSNGNLTGVLDARGRRTQYDYDALERRRTTVFPDGRRILFEYNPDGHLIRTTDCNGVRREYTVDALGRPTRIDVDASGAPGVEVGGAVVEQFTYDGLDRCIIEENDFARREIRYNSLGWPLSESVFFSTPVALAGGPFSLTREFDDVGAAIAVTYPNGRRLTRTYDALSRLTGIRNVIRGADYPGHLETPDAHQIANFVYAGRQRISIEYGNGAGVKYAHDGAGRLIEIDHRAASIQALTLQYLFDGAGNLRVRQDVAPLGSTAQKFAYDSIYRLVSEVPEAAAPFNTEELAPANAVPAESIPDRQEVINSLVGSLNMPTGPLTFTYDAVGNRELERATNGTGVQYTNNELDQCISRGTSNGEQNVFGYDANGNLTTDGTRKYVYDSLSRLVRVEDVQTGGVIASFIHDAGRRRVLERANESVTQLVYDGENVVSEYRNGELLAQYVHDTGVDRPLQIAAAGEEHWYHADLTRSVRLLTDRDGVQATAYKYTSFGQAVESVSAGPYNPMRFAGRRLDNGLGTYDYRARQYDPDLGRFLQRDPMGQADGTNLYAYTRNNPLTLGDPFGTDSRPEQERQSPQATLGKYGWGAFLFPGINSKAWRRIDPFSLSYEDATTIESSWIRIGPVTDIFAQVPQLSQSDFESALRFGLPEGDALTDFERELAKGRWGRTMKIVIDPESGTAAYRGYVEAGASDYYSRYGEIIASTSGRGLESPGFTPIDAVSLGAALAGGLGKHLLSKLAQRSTRKAAAGAIDTDHLQSIARELREAIPKLSGGRKTVALGLVEDDDGARYLIWTANRNWTNRRFLEPAAERLGVYRWTTHPRAVGRGAVGAPGDAEQILIDAADEYGMRVIGVVPSRKACLDCIQALEADGITLIPPAR